MVNLEQLCEIQHKIWSRCVSGMLKKVREDGSVLISPSAVDRYKKLAAMDYKELSEKSKQNIQTSVSGYLSPDDQEKEQVSEEQVSQESNNQESSVQETT